MTPYCNYIITPLGKILLLSDGNALTGLYFATQKNIPTLDAYEQGSAHLPIFLCVQKQLSEYFQETRQTFEFPYVLTTGTVFQQRVWNAIAKIPFKSTLSYRQLAEHIGAPQSIRAVAQATGRNPISLVIPCHRVIGSNGSMTGYAGGLERKQILLALEQNHDWKTKYEK